MFYKYNFGIIYITNIGNNWSITGCYDSNEIFCIILDSGAKKTIKTAIKIYREYYRDNFCVPTFEKAFPIFYDLFEQKKPLEEIFDRIEKLQVLL